jgi:hypothetical protein
LCLSSNQKDSEEKNLRISEVRDAPSTTQKVATTGDVKRISVNGITVAERKRFSQRLLVVALMI